MLLLLLVIAFIVEPVSPHGGVATEEMISALIARERELDGKMVHFITTDYAGRGEILIAPETHVRTLECRLSVSGHRYALNQEYIATGAAATPLLGSRDLFLWDGSTLRAHGTRKRVDGAIQSACRISSLPLADVFEEPWTTCLMWRVAERHGGPSMSALFSTSVVSNPVVGPDGESSWTITNPYPRNALYRVTATRSNDGTPLVTRFEKVLHRLKDDGAIVAQSSFITRAEMVGQGHDTGLDAVAISTLEKRWSELNSDYRALHESSAQLISWFSGFNSLAGETVALSGELLGQAFSLEQMNIERVVNRESQYLERQYFDVLNELAGGVGVTAIEYAWYRQRQMPFVNRFIGTRVDLVAILTEVCGPRQLWSETLDQIASDYEVDIARLLSSRREHLVRRTFDLRAARMSDDLEAYVDTAIKEGIIDSMIRAVTLQHASRMEHAMPVKQRQAFGEQFRFGFYAVAFEKFPIEVMIARWLNDNPGHPQWPVVDSMGRRLDSQLMIIRAQLIDASDSFASTQVVREREIARARAIFLGAQISTDERWTRLTTLRGELESIANEMFASFAQFAETANLPSSLHAELSDGALQSGEPASSNRARFDPPLLITHEQQTLIGDRLGLNPAQEELLRAIIIQHQTHIDGRREALQRKLALITEERADLEVKQPELSTRTAFNAFGLRYARVDAEWVEAVQTSRSRMFQEIATDLLRNDQQAMWTLLQNEFSVERAETFIRQYEPENEPFLRLDQLYGTVEDDVWSDEAISLRDEYLSLIASACATLEQEAPQLVVERWEAWQMAGQINDEVRNVLNTVFAKEAENVAAIRRIRDRYVPRFAAECSEENRIGFLDAYYAVRQPNLFRAAPLELLGRAVESERRIPEVIRELILRSIEPHEVRYAAKRTRIVTTGDSLHQKIEAIRSLVAVQRQGTQVASATLSDREFAALPASVRLLLSWHLSPNDV